MVQCACRCNKKVGLAIAMASAEAPQVLVEQLDVVRHAGGVPFARVCGLARSVLGTVTRAFSRREYSCFSLVVLLGVPTTVFAFLLRTLSSIQTLRRRQALADVAHQRRALAAANILAAATEPDSAKSGQQQDVLQLSFLDLQKRLKDGTVTAETVLASYRAQAGRAHAKVNCLTEFLPEAIEVAQVSSPALQSCPIDGKSAGCEI